MSIDLKGERLFISALRNNTVEVVDLRASKRARTIGQLNAPQGVLYVPETDRLYVANADDGSVRVFNASSYAPLKTLDYGDAADNLRYGSAHERVDVGYGSGALGEIDSDSKKIADIKLDAHPESFQLEKNSPRIYVNLPGHEKSTSLIEKGTQSWQPGRRTWHLPLSDVAR